MSCSSLRSRWVCMKCRVSLALLCGIVLSSPVFAGQTAASATVTGIVRDASDAVVPGAAVLLRNHETNQLQKTVTDGAGRFRLIYVPVGDYHLSVDAPGFGPVSVNLA